MDILVTIQDHKRSLLAKEYFTEQLDSSFGHYSFITKCLMRSQMNTGSDMVRLTLEMNVKQGAPIFVEAVEPDEKLGLRALLKKAKKKIERYKDKHYHSLSNRPS